MADAIRHLDDPTRSIDAKRDRVLHAYKHWILVHGRQARGSEYSSAAQFRLAVRGLLEVGRDQLPKKIGLPGTAQGYANWKAKKYNETFRLRLDVCKAVYVLTGIDVSAQGDVSSAAINPTDMVTLTGVELRASSEEGRNEVFVESVDFHASSSHAVYLSDTTKRPKPGDDRKRIGSVTYVLREASLAVNSECRFVRLFNRMSERTRQTFGSIDGATLLPEPLETNRWRVQPTALPGPLKAWLENLRLGTVKIGTRKDPEVVVSAERPDIDPIIALEQPVANYAAKHEIGRASCRERVSSPL